LNRRGLNSQGRHIDLEGAQTIIAAIKETPDDMPIDLVNREDDSEPVPVHEAPPTVPASKAQEEHSAAPGILSRVVAKIRGH
jgi:hypothetical protein